MLCVLLFYEKLRHTENFRQTEILTAAELLYQSSQAPETKYMRPDQVISE